MKEVAATSPPRGPVASLFLLLGLATACQSPAPPRLEEAPQPILDRFDAEVRSQLTDALTTARQTTAASSQSRREAAGAWGRLGRLFLAYELPEAARISFRNAGALDPQDASFDYYLGVLHLSRGESEEAAERFGRVARSEPDNLAAWIRLGEVQLNLGRFDSAEDAFQRARRGASTAAAAHLGLGRLAALRGQARAAATHFEEALRIQPEATQIHYPLAQAYRQLGDLDKARSHLAKRGEATVSYPDPRISDLASLTVGAPGHAHRADQAVLEGRLDVAAQEYRQAVALAPRDYYYRKSLALTEYQIGDTRGALREMEQAIGLSSQEGSESRSVPDKELSQAHFTLGGMLANNGESGAAGEEFRKAIRLDPGNLEAQFQIGRLEGQAGRLLEALQHFQEILRRNPDHIEANRLAATTLMDLGRFSEALSPLRRLIDLEPDNERTRWLLKVATERARR